MVRGKGVCAVRWCEWAGRGKDIYMGYIYGKRTTSWEYSLMGFKACCPSCVQHSFFLSFSLLYYSTTR